MRAWQSRGGQELGESWLTPNREAALSSGFQGKETQLLKTDFLQFFLVCGINLDCLKKLLNQHFFFQVTQLF